MYMHAVRSADLDLSGTEAGRAATAARCIGPCEFRAATSWHHDQLLAAADSVDGALDLVDLALTWGELDYSGEQFIGPIRWAQFAAEHRWPDPARAKRLFWLAEDIAMHSMPGSGQSSPGTTVQEFIAM